MGFAPVKPIQLHIVTTNIIGFNMLDISIHRIQSIIVTSNTLDSGAEVKTLIITTETGKHDVTLFADNLNQLEFKTEVK